MAAVEPDLAVRRARVGDVVIAYRDVGAGPPLVLLHGCPFSSFMWRHVIAALADRYRCLAPDLLGLGDTETPRGADWSLPAQAAAVSGLLDALGVEGCAVVGHDHGAAVAQLLAVRQPRRVNALVLANAEAYDNWPSAHERPFVRVTQLPGVGRLVLWAWSRRRLLRQALATGKAVSDRAVLTDELVDGYVGANFADGHRRAKTRRFLAGQLDPANRRHTAQIADGLRQLDVPTLIVWGADDVHFDVRWGRRLADDIPGARLELLAGVGHLVMEEAPMRVAHLIAEFLSTVSPHDERRG
jgi:pimeloyl-ACP methyl ester carboxylesterase